MQPPCLQTADDPDDAGFVLYEVLVGLLISAALAVLLLQLIASEMAQSQRLVRRNSDALALSHARRTFLAEAGRSRGEADATAIGRLRIIGNQLVLRQAGRSWPIHTWQTGQGRFAFGGPGAAAIRATEDVTRDTARFVWSDGAVEMVWIAP
jgi:hypothetical protein